MKSGKSHPFLVGLLVATVVLVLSECGLASFEDRESQSAPQNDAGASSAIEQPANSPEEEFEAIGAQAKESLEQPESSSDADTDQPEASADLASDQPESEGEMESEQPIASEGTSPESKPVLPMTPKPVTESFPLLDRDKWNSRMPLPDDAQISGFVADTRSPYIVCWPEFPGTTGYYEYSVDFRADSQPAGTYVNIGSWDMDTSDLQSRYASVTADDGYALGGGYAGFQVLSDGSRVAIMSIWNIYVTDENGNVSTIAATRTYPENPRVGQGFEGEGTGVQCIVDYDWQPGRTYRALIQCGQTAEGNCELLFYVCDLETGRWDELIAYDLGYGNTCITNNACFLEDFNVEHAAEVRTVEWSNFRANSREVGMWVSATSALLERQFNDWVGSYAYGSDDTCFWAVTSAVPDLCAAPPNRERYYVSTAAEGSPY